MSKNVLIAIAIVLVIAITILLRRYVLPDRLTDKLEDMFTPKNDTQKNIYTAALERLKRKFSNTQAELLAKYMVLQSQFESNNYKSNVFMKNNNAFGYKFYSGSAYQIGVGTAAPQTGGDGGNYAKYATVQDSAREVADWIGRGQSAFSKVVTVDDYATALKIGRPGYEYYHTPTGTTVQSSIAEYSAGMKKYL